MAFVSGMTSGRAPGLLWGRGSRVCRSGSGVVEESSQGRPLYTLSCELVLVLGRPRD
jgi:hypothetical protein